MAKHVKVNAKVPTIEEENDKVLKEYRNRPSVVKAYQWNGILDDSLTPGIHRDIQIAGVPDLGPYVVTAHLQKVYIKAGDYIIQESDGEHYYPCKAEIFEAKYEAV